MSIALRSLLPTLPAVFLALTFSANAARAASAGANGATSALDISVQVVRACAVDTTLTGTTSKLDAALRAGLVVATQASLATSCGAQTQIALVDVHVSLLEPLGTVPRLDVEF